MSPLSFDEGTYTFTLNVSKPAAHLYSTASSTVTILPKDAEFPPSVKIAPLTTAKVNPTEMITLRGSASSFYDRELEYEWSCEKGSFDLSATGAVLGSVEGPNIVIAADMLDGGKTYTFKLTVNDGGLYSGYSELTFLTNEAPHGGSFSISPSSDIHAFTDTVTISVDPSSWVDADTPFTYDYSFMLPGDSSPTPLMTGTGSSSFSIFLPCVDSYDVTEVELIVYVIDCYGARGSSSLYVNVSKTELSNDVSAFYEFFF